MSISWIPGVSAGAGFDDSRVRSGNVRDWN